MYVSDGGKYCRELCSLVQISANLFVHFFFTNLEAKLSKCENLDFSTNLGTSQVEEKFLTFSYKLNCKHS